MDSKECVKVVVEALQDKKANDIHIIEIIELNLKK